jgi:exoribonuclease II
VADMRIYTCCVERLMKTLNLCVAVLLTQLHKIAVINTPACVEQKMVENVVLLIFTLFCSITATLFKLKYKCHKLLSIKQHETQIYSDK